MRWETIKSREDFHISANVVTIEPDFIGDTLMGVAIRADGEVVYSVRKRGYDNLELVRPAGPETIEVYRVVGMLSGMTVQGEYEDEYDAKNNARDLVGRGGTATINKVQVPKSTFVAATKPASAASPALDDEIPF